jgi:hypothetical protein
VLLVVAVVVAEVVEEGSGVHTVTAPSQASPSSPGPSRLNSARLSMFEKPRTTSSSRDVALGVAATGRPMHVPASCGLNVLRM